MKLYFVQFPDGSLKTHAKANAYGYEKLGTARGVLAHVKKYYRGIRGIDESKIVYAEFELQDLPQ